MVCAALYSSDGSSPKATKALSASLRQRRPNSITQSSGSIWTLLPSARSIESRPAIGARQELLSVLGCWQFCSLSALAREMSECPRHALYVNPDLAIVTVAADRGDECPRCGWLGLSRAGTPCEVRRLSSAADPPRRLTKVAEARPPALFARSGLSEAAGHRACPALTQPRPLVRFAISAIACLLFVSDLSRRLRSVS
jgi:hypothetical protein